VTAITSVVAEFRHPPALDAVAPPRALRVALPIALLAVLALAVVEVLNAAGAVGPGRGPVGVTLGVVATRATIAAAATAVRDRSAIRGVLAELRASEQQAAGITSIAVDSIITIDEQQRIIVFNHGAEATFGWSAAEVMGQPLSILLPERLRDVHARHIQRFGAANEVARRMGQRQEIVGLRHDGIEFPAEASISRLDLPTGRLYTVLLRDGGDIDSSRTSASSRAPARRSAPRSITRRRYSARSTSPSRTSPTAASSTSSTMTALRDASRASMTTRITRRRSACSSIGKSRHQTGRSRSRACSMTGWPLRPMACPMSRAVPALIRASRRLRESGSRR
jgi:PAS domain S-box-containing protein